MNQLLGFVVLTGPLWLILILLPVSIWIAIKFTKRFKSGGAKFAGGLGIFVLAFLLPFADEIVGRLFLNVLCATQAGVKVYQTIELPAEYWDKEGRPKFLNEQGYGDIAALDKQFEWRDIRERHINFIIKIDKWHWQLQDRLTKKVLGEKITFLRYFGWINNFSTAPNIGESCRDLGGEFNRAALLRKEREEDQSLFLGIFKPATTR